MSLQKVEKVNNELGNFGIAIFEAIHTVMHLIRSRQYQVFRNCPYALTHMEGKVLSFIARHPNARLSDVVAHTGRDKGQLAQIVKTLRTHDLLAATEDPKDRRSVLLQTTKEGAKIHRVLEEELSDITDVAVHSLSIDERAELLRLLQHLRTSVETQ